MEALIGGVVVTVGHERKGQNMKTGIGVSLAAISASGRKVAARTSVAQRRAFTLVELLVVILIIALLTALFLP
jgi:prepilin-type N-terminal cleavage/methylation domain-containing protein